MTLIKQNSLTIWLTGLPGSGKTTLALALEKEIFKKGYLSVVLDGDKIRSGINTNGDSVEESTSCLMRKITPKLILS